MGAIAQQGLFAAGLAMLNRGEAAAAVAVFQRCVAIAPQHAGALYNLGTALLQTGRDIDALGAFLTCLGYAPGFGEAYVNLAATMRRLTLLDDAQAMAELGLVHLPDSPEATICLARILTDKTDFAAATKLYRKLLDRVPEHAGALSNLADILLATGCVAEAVAMHNRAVLADPVEPRIRFNRGTALLQAGDFAQGWNDYEARWQLPGSQPRGFGEQWQGQHIAGQTILLHAEQGLGDTLQFVRYAPMVADRGARVVLEVQPPLVRLLRQTSSTVRPGSIEVAERGDPLPPFDTHCSLLSLPRAFATRLETIPAQVPYVHPDPVATAFWATKLPTDDRLRIGLIWAAASRPEDRDAYLSNERRSINLHDFAPLGEIGGTHFISLQKGQPGVAAQAPNALKLIDPMEEVADLADTAALIANLDLIISVDTSVAHLAGAMGRPVWLLARYDACWRWLHSREDSPWYPSMRIYRQERPLDWAGVVDRVRTDLRAFAAIV